MSNQLQITGGAKVRNLEGVLIGTSGVVSSLAINVPSGIPQLDGSGKILVSQLPNSVMEYKGTWNAATNTPTLVNGTGNQGDVYLCSVAGTVNFGAGAITFNVGDQVIYSGSIWQRASGATGTVTSVAVTESGDSLNITGSPITTSGTINIGFNGTNLQYINGAGNLTTFPALTGYVPYTGATANVDLGTFNLTADVITGATGSFTSNGGSNTFAINHSSGAGIALNITKGGNNEGLYINKTSGSGNAATITGGVTLLDELHLTTDLADAYIASAATWNAKQNAITLTTTGTSGAATLIGATLNIPNYGSALSGYLPLSGGTLTGLLNGTSADFSSSVSALELLLDSAGTASATFVKNTNGTGVISTGSNQIGFNLNNAFFISSDNKGCSIFSFNHSSSAYTYTLPSSNGTIALTTDLGSYLPLAGGTLTGALNGTSAVFSSTVQASAYRLTGMTGGSGALYWSSDRVTLANYNATGVVNIEANGGTSVAVFGGATYNNDFVGTLRNTTSAYFATTSGNVGIGNVSASYKLDVSGTGRFTGTLTGAAGTFAGNLSVTGNNLFTLAATNTSARIGEYDATNRICFTANQNGANAQDDATKPSWGLVFNANSTNTAFIGYKAAGGGSAALSALMTITGTGVTSFVNTVDVAVNVTNSTSGLNLVNNQGSGYGNSLNYYTSTTKFGSIQVESGVANTSEMAFKTMVGSTLATRMFINSAGLVSIGTINPSTGRKLTIADSGGTYLGYINSGSGARIYTTGVDSSGYIIYDDTAGAYRMQVSSSGVVTINALGSGSVTATSGVLSAVSDMNLKIEDGFIDNALEKVLKLKPRYFLWKEETGLPTDLRQLGFYAQEVNEAIGEEGANTPKGENDKWGIYDRAIIAMLTKAMQEQNEVIEDLKARLDNAGL
jgi:hypothetical protein